METTSSNPIKTNDLVSIGIPVLNGAKYIANAIESACCQSHSNLEIIISDNGSDDDTLAIIKRYKEQDSRIKVVKNANASFRRKGTKDQRTAQSNFAYTLSLATGKYFAWLAHDDYWDKKFIDKCISNIGSTGACFGRAEMMDYATRTSKIISLPDLNPTQSHIRQVFRLLNAKDKGSSVLFYSLYDRKKLQSIALPILNSLPFDWLDLYIVTSVASKHKITCNTSDSTLFWYGYTGSYIVKPVNNLSVNTFPLRQRLPWVFFNALISTIINLQ